MISVEERQNMWNVLRRVATLVLPTPSGLVKRLVALSSLPSSSLPQPVRCLPSVVDSVWVLFLVWTAIGFVVMPLGIGEVEIRRWLGDGMIRHAILAVLRVSDALWIGLAAVVVYFHTVAAEGLSTARRWSIIILLGSATAEWIGASTGFPFGPYQYTQNFGWLIGGVLPAAIPLAWLVILLCGRVLTLRLKPDATRLELALGVGLIAVLTDINLEFVAWKVRGYWVWYPALHGGGVPAWPPLQNFVAWFVLSLALTFVLPPNYSLRLRRLSPARPLAVIALMNALFVVVYVARFLRFRVH